jgi:hypothetical protein
MSALAALVLSLAACASETVGTTSGGTTVEVTGYVHAGPVCPVEQSPPDPACADRPVEGAVMFVTGLGDTLVAEAVSDGEGTFVVMLPPGTYRLVPQPVEGLLGTAPAQEFMATVGTTLDVAYDTGIR